MNEVKQNQQSFSAPDTCRHGDCPLDTVLSRRETSLPQGSPPTPGETWPCRAWTSASPEAHPTLTLADRVLNPT